MSDNSFMSVMASTYDNAVEVEYRECVGLVTVEIGRGQLFLTPADAAVVAEKLLAALDVYASTLRAVA